MPKPEDRYTVKITFVMEKEGAQGHLMTSSDNIFPCLEYGEAVAMEDMAIRYLKELNDVAKEIDKAMKEPK